MNTNLDIWSVILYAMIAVIGYFLKGTMDRLNKLEDEYHSRWSELQVLKNDHANKYDSMSEKFDELKKVMQDLTKEISDLNKRIK